MDAVLGKTAIVSLLSCHFGKDGHSLGKDCSSLGIQLGKQTNSCQKVLEAKKECCFGFTQRHTGFQSG